MTSQLVTYLGRPAIQTVFWDVTDVVVALVVLGLALEIKAKGRTSQAIKKLIGLRARNARVIRDGAEIYRRSFATIHPTPNSTSPRRSGGAGGSRSRRRRSRASACCCSGRGRSPRRSRSGSRRSA